MYTAPVFLMARPGGMSRNTTVVMRMRSGAGSRNIRGRSARPSEPARRIAGQSIPPHACFAHIQTLGEPFGIVFRVSLSDAGTLLIGVGDLLRTPRKADPSGDQDTEAKRLHGVPPMMRPVFSSGRYTSSVFCPNSL